MGEICLKRTSGVFVGVFVIFSLTFILYGLSSMLAFKKTTDDILATQNVACSSLGVVICGLILLSLVIVGCCGVCKEVPRCLEIYCVLLLLLALAQLSLGIFSLVSFNNNKIQDDVYACTTRMFENFEKNPTLMDNTQDTLQCCGIEGYKDYNETTAIPKTCCPPDDTKECTSGNVYETGCALTLFRFVVGTNLLIGVLLILVAVLELIAAGLGLWLSRGFWKTHQPVSI